MRSSPIDIRERDPYAVDQLPVKERYRSDVGKVLAPGGEIEDRIERLAGEISRDRSGRGDRGTHLVCVLKGAMRFFDALVRRLDLDDLSTGVARSNRYAGGEPAADRAEVRLFDPGMIEGADVLVVEDMIDEGHTLDALFDRIGEHDPNSVDAVVLFDKVARREADVEVAYTGFLIPDEFVVGYGIDYDERYRDLRHLAVLDEAAVEP